MLLDVTYPVRSLIKNDALGLDSFSLESDVENIRSNILPDVWVDIHTCCFSPYSSASSIKLIVSILSIIFQGILKSPRIKTS